MTTDINNTTTTEYQYSCVTTQQKAIYNWYETCHSDDDVVDIYSPEWHERITSWHAWFVETHGDHEHSEAVKLREAPEELDFRSFFFEHPVAAFSLWHVIQAFYNFDKAVCVTSHEAEPTLVSWKKLKPFDYLKSGDVELRWKTDLEQLDAEIAAGKLAGEELESRVYDILCAVERIEAALDSLEDDLKFDYHETKPVDWMLDTVNEAFDRRCLMIAKLQEKSANVPPAYEAVASGEFICKIDSCKHFTNSKTMQALERGVLYIARWRAILPHLYLQRTINISICFYYC
jgi:hypothetical protein